MTFCRLKALSEEPNDWRRLTLVNSGWRWPMVGSAWAWTDLIVRLIPDSTTDIDDECQLKSRKGKRRLFFNYCIWCSTWRTRSETLEGPGPVIVFLHHVTKHFMFIETSSIQKFWNFCSAGGIYSQFTYVVFKKLFFCELTKLLVILVENIPTMIQVLQIVGSLV